MRRARVTVAYNADQMNKRINTIINILWGPRRGVILSMGAVVDQYIMIDYGSEVW